MLTAIQTRSSLQTSDAADFSLSPDVILVTVHDGSARLLDMAGRFHAVPAVGTIMLQETLANGAAAAVNRVSQDYGVDTTQVRNDLAVFLRELEDQGLLCSRRNRPRWRRTNTWLARLFLRPALYAIHRVLRSQEAKARALLGLARIAFGLFGWSRTISVWKEAHSRYAARQAGEPEEQAVGELDEVVRAAAANHPLGVECKERALCCWALARAAGLDAAVVVGIDLFPLAGHCWCEVGSRTLSDYQDRCVAYTPVGRW
jgi:hypothetical protein